jgi:hypothetical protein
MFINSDRDVYYSDRDVYYSDRDVKFRLLRFEFPLKMTITHPIKIE